MSAIAGRTQGIEVQSLMQYAGAVQYDDTYFNEVVSVPHARKSLRRSAEHVKRDRLLSGVQFLMLAMFADAHIQNKAACPWKADKSLCSLS